MQKQTRWLPILGLLLDSNWLYLAPFLNLSNVTQGAFISELSANGQPYALLFRSLDIAAGLVWIIAAFYWVRIKKSALSRLFSLILVTLGLADVIDSILPLDCSETINMACRTATGFTLDHNVHLYESCISVIVFTAITMTLLISLHYNRLRGQLYFITVTMLTMMLIWLVDTVYRQHAHLEGYGYLQRLFEVSFISWFIYFWHMAGTQPKYLPRLVVRPPLRRRLKRLSHMKFNR